jgi:hypothetical protein
VSSSDGRFTLVFPVGALSVPTEIEFHALAPGPPSPSGERPLGSVWQVSAMSPGAAATAASTPVTSFNAQVEVLVTYGTSPPDEIAWWNGSRWVRLHATALSDVHRMVAHTTHVGVLAAFTAADESHVTTALVVTVAVAVLAAAAAANIGTWARGRRGRA